MENYPIHIEIQPRVHLIRGGNQARFPEANTLLVDDEILTLVDAGTNPGRIFSTLRDLGRLPSDLDRILLTHYHTDHKGYAAYLRSISDCEVLCHPLSKDAIVSFDSMLKTIGIINHKLLEDWMHLLSRKLPHTMSDYIVDGTFHEDKPIDCGDVQLLPFLAPGHTHDHTCFGINDYETILLVDIDLTRFGPWYGNVTSEIEDFKKSIQHIIDLQPKMGISSHLIDPVIVELEDRLRSYLAVFQERDERIVKNIADGVDTVKKLAQLPTIYPRIPYLVYIAFEEFMLEKHIDLLIKKGQVINENGRLHVQRI